MRLAIRQRVENLMGSEARAIDEIGAKDLIKRFAHAGCQGLAVAE